MRRQLLAPPTHNSAHNLHNRLRDAILKAAGKAVPRGARKGAKAWWNEGVEEALGAARSAKAEWMGDTNDEAKHDHWRACEKTATKRILEAKAASYEELLEKLDLRKEGLVRSLERQDQR